MPAVSEQADQHSKLPLHGNAWCDCGATPLAGPCSIKSELCMKLAGPFLEIARKLGSRPPARLSLGASHRHAGDQRNGRRSLAHRPISRLSWHGVGPMGRPKSATCSPTFAILATLATVQRLHLARFLAPWRITLTGRKSATLSRPRSAGRVVCSSAGSDDRSSDFAANSRSPSA